MILTSYSFSPEQYGKVKDRIRLDTSRDHMDGLCCFFKRKEQKHHKPGIGGDILLVNGSVHVPYADKPLEDIIRGGIYNWEMFYPCKKLEIKHCFMLEKKEMGWAYMLTLIASCGIYENRPERCRSYPENRSCNYDRYACSPEEQKDKGKVVSLSFFAFDEDKDHLLRDYSAGEMRKLFKKRILIPVPIDGRKRCRK